MLTSQAGSVVLIGDPARRPPGIERELGRAGFRVVDDVDAGNLASGEPADSAAVAGIVIIPPGTTDIGSMVSDAVRHVGRNVPVIALLPVADPGEVIRALSAGAADALLPPVHLGELAERLSVRLRERQLGAEGRVAGALAPLIEQASGALRTDELLRLVAARLVKALDLARADVLLVHATEGYARRVGMVPGQADEDTRLDLHAWSGLAEAAAASGPVLMTPPVRSVARALDEASRALALSVSRGPGESVLLLLVPRAGHDLSPAQVAFAQEVLAGLGAALAAPALPGALAPRPDPLTGLDLGRAFEQRVQVELERARRYALGFAIVMLDVDGLAAFNSRHGSEAGDALLKRIAALLAREVRLPDAVARLGGDEFALLLPETGLDGAQTAVRRIRLRLDDARLGTNGTPGVSVGVVTLPYPEVYHPDEVLALAEAALLRAKQVERVVNGVAP